MHEIIILIIYQKLGSVGPAQQKIKLPSPYHCKNIAVQYIVYIPYIFLGHPIFHHVHPITIKVTLSSLNLNICSMQKNQPGSFPHKKISETLPLHIVIIVVISNK